jgi:hypothetical protein
MSACSDSRFQVEVGAWIRGWSRTGNADFRFAPFPAPCKRGRIVPTRSSTRSAAKPMSPDELRPCGAEVGPMARRGKVHEVAVHNETLESNQHWTQARAALIAV